MLASTDAERDQLATHYGAVPERIEVVPPGVDHSVFFPADAAVAKDRLGLDGRRMLLFAGRIQPLKGVGMAVRCLAELATRTRCCSWSAARAAPTATRSWPGCATLAHELGVAANVHFVPPQPHTRLADFYRAADVCIVPSRAESFGLVALEAAACGTPVVAASVGGLRSLVDDGATGFLVDDRDPGGLRGAGRDAARRSRARGGDRRDRVGAVAQVLVEHHRGATPPSVRRSRRPRSRALRLT